MVLDSERLAQLARAQDLRKRGEWARRRDGATARQCYEESVAILRQLERPLILAHTVRHLGDVYSEEGSRDLAESCYDEALNLYRNHSDRSPLDLANAIRSLAVLRSEQAKALWEEAREIYATVGIDAGVKEATARVTALTAAKPISERESSTCKTEETRGT
jgi:tetratricopeptide (TPR) repeat protein